MQTSAKLQNAQSAFADAAFCVVARQAQQASRTSPIVTVIRAWVAFLLGSSIALRSAKHQSADSAFSILHNHQCVKLLGGHASSPSTGAGISLRQCLGICFDQSPLLLPICLIIGAASSLLFWGAIVGSTALLDLGTGVVFPTAGQFLLAVFLVVCLHLGAVTIPLFRGAVTLFHRGLRVTQRTLPLVTLRIKKERQDP